MSATILLPVDAAYAFDYLAILMVKQDRGLQVNGELSRLEKFLEAQLGEDEMRKVMKSGEFHASYVANGNVFEAIEAAHTGTIPARRVQEINHQRFEAKRALQKRFWPKVELMEKKTKL